ncbi:hypothetical protein [Legionella brunensis]|uniref:Uncharacterized protein n=1 Tax=Legionella brunensis TaxID=29422 RepID=A0A0W0SLB8_9GAMM|nr:hypothetical protein [Legionella brunensis]KTC84215.1 hypothetical protein Lbru_1576 [Legionella brunensis]
MKKWQIKPMKEGQSFAGFLNSYDPEFELNPDVFTAFFEEHVFELQQITSLKLVKFKTGKFYLSFSTENEQQLNDLMGNLKIFKEDQNMMGANSIAWHTEENGWIASMRCSIYDNGLVATKEQLGAILIEISKIHPFSSQMAQSLNDVLKFAKNLEFILAVPSLEEQCVRYIQKNINFFSEKISNLPPDLREQIATMKP